MVSLAYLWGRRKKKEEEEEEEEEKGALKEADAICVRIF